MFVFKPHSRITPISVLWNHSSNQGQPCSRLLYPMYSLSSPTILGELIRINGGYSDKWKAKEQSRDGEITQVAGVQALHVQSHELNPKLHIMPPNSSDLTLEASTLSSTNSASSHIPRLELSSLGVALTTWTLLARLSPNWLYNNSNQIPRVIFSFSLLALIKVAVIYHCVKDQSDV